MKHLLHEQGLAGVSWVGARLWSFIEPKNNFSDSFFTAGDVASFFVLYV